MKAILNNSLATKTSRYGHSSLRDRLRHKVLIKYRLKQMLVNLFRKVQFTDQTASMFDILSDLESSWQKFMNNQGKKENNLVQVLI